MRVCTLRRWVEGAWGDVGRHSQGSDDRLVKRVPIQASSRTVESLPRLSCVSLRAVSVPFVNWRVEVLTRGALL